MDTRTCARCGKAFVPPREHARFCSARCRIAWNRDNFLNPDKLGAANWAPDKQHDPQTQASALQWAVIGMRDAAERLGGIRPVDRTQAFTAIGEAVWWVTIVDATMVRYHPQEYEAALEAIADAERERTEGTFGGLRFVRNRMGYHADHADFISAEPGGDGAGRDGAGHGPVTAWTWRPRPKPALDTLPPRGRRWEMERYRAYQEWLAGRTMGETFDRSAGFLSLAADLAGGGADGGGGRGRDSRGRDSGRGSGSGGGSEEGLPGFAPRTPARRAGRRIL